VSVKINYQNTHFITSAPDIRHLPEDEGIEIAFHIVDLPGYGFAQVPLELKKKWQKSLGEYLQQRQCLKGLVVLMDIRHPMKDLDQQLIFWAVDSGIPVQVLLTKADKLKSGARKAQMLSRH